jgi:hypothetical protein
MVTLKPSAVAVGVPKVGVSAAPVIEVPATVAEPALNPVLVVVCVMVAEVPGVRPVTVKTRLEPVVEMTATAPTETVGAAQVNAKS